MIALDTDKINTLIAQVEKMEAGIKSLFDHLETVANNDAHMADTIVALSNHLTDLETRLAAAEDKIDHGCPP